MSSGSRDPGPPTLTLAGIDDNTNASNQEAVPVPMFFGEGPIAAKWISPIYNQFAQEAPQGQQGKK